MKLSLTTTLAFASSVLISGSTATQIPFDANFDDLDPIPAEPALNIITIYKNMSFTNFNVAEAKIAGVAVEGVLPHSGSDLAGLPSQPGALSTVYPGSKTKSLSLKSFYFGCVIFILESVATVAEPCNVTVTGFRAGSETPAVTQTFVFEPAEAVDVQNAPTFGAFASAFQGLQSVKFTYVPASVEALLVDDIVGFLQT